MRGSVLFLARLPATGPGGLVRLEPTHVRVAGCRGSFGFADPDARIWHGYVMNKMDFYLQDDPREKAVREALYRAIARVAGRTRALETVGAS